MTLTKEEKDALLERFDLTDPALQRDIVADFAVRAFVAEMALNVERRQTASKLRDIARRIGVAATNEFIRSEIERVANQLEFWSQGGEAKNA